MDQTAQPTYQPAPNNTSPAIPLKSNTTKVAAWVLASAIVVLGGYIALAKYQQIWPFASKGIACTTEAKICPDGTSVGRTGPNCEFTACPSVTPDETAGWKTYTNTQYGFEFKYPNELKISSTLPDVVNWSWASGVAAPYPLQLGILYNPEGVTAEQFVLTDPGHKDFPYTIIARNYLANDGTTGILVSDPITGGENEYEFFWVTKSSLFRLSSTDLSRLKSILSTFKFTR